MGRLIDIDVLFDYFGNDAIDKTTRSNIEYFVSEKGIVKAIPKTDYENRLKADLKAILVDLQLEIEELNHKGSNCYRDGYTPYSEGLDDCKDIIQQKINSLKEAKDVSS